MCVWGVYKDVHVCAGDQRIQMRFPLGFKLLAVVCCLMWVLGLT